MNVWTLELPGELFGLNQECCEFSKGFLVDDVKVSSLGGNRKVSTTQLTAKKRRGLTCFNRPCGEGENGEKSRLDEMLKPFSLPSSIQNLELRSIHVQRRPLGNPASSFRGVPLSC